MSFSSELKENLSKIQNLKNKKLVKFELIGYLISNNTTCDKKNIYYTTVNEYNINRFSKLLSNINISNFKIDIKVDGTSVYTQSNVDKNSTAISTSFSGKGKVQIVVNIQDGNGASYTRTTELDLSKQTTYTAQ